MNYWSTLSAGLEECFEPLISFVKELHKVGKKTAKQFYGVDGFVSHHSSDLWAQHTQAQTIWMVVVNGVFGECQVVGFVKCL